jgi:hypothetical protein
LSARSMSSVASSRLLDARDGELPIHPVGGEPDPANTPLVSGTVQKVDEAAGKVTLDHERIPNIDMDASSRLLDARDGELPIHPVGGEPDPVPGLHSLQDEATEDIERALNPVLPTASCTRRVGSPARAH